MFNPCFVKLPADFFQQAGPDDAPTAVVDKHPVAAVFFNKLSNMIFGRTPEENLRRGIVGKISHGAKILLFGKMRILAA